MEQGHKNAKAIRKHYKERGEGSTLGPACNGCGRMKNESNPPAYRGFCADHDDPDGHSVICPDCGTEYWGYYVWQDQDGTKAIWDFNDPGDKTVKCEPEEVKLEDFTGRAGQLATGRGEYQEDEQGNRDWFYTCGCHLSSGGGSYGTHGSAYAFNPCENHID